MYWYRLEVALGHNSVVGTTVRRADLPRHLLADEHHQTRDGHPLLPAQFSQLSRDFLFRRWGIFGSQARYIR
jgi:hypothetical protein